MSANKVTLTTMKEVMSMLPDFYYANKKLKAKIIKKCRKIINRGNSFALVQEIEQGGFFLDEFSKETPKELINTFGYWYYNFIYDELAPKKVIPLSKATEIKLIAEELNDLNSLIVNKLVDLKVVPFVDNESELITTNAIQKIFEEYFNVNLE